MSMKSRISIITLVLLAALIFFARHEISLAWGLLDSVNLLILFLLIPIQLASYYAVGGMIFSYLKSKGDIQHLSHWETTRMALELNFVNHILPSGGAAGFSYLAWVLGKHGVSAGRATMAQVVRFFTAFTAFIFILMLSLIVLVFDHMINKIVLSISALITVTVLGGVIFAVYAISNHSRLIKFSVKATNFVNKAASIFSRGKKKDILTLKKTEKFFTEMHEDYVEIKRDKRILIAPFIWAILTNVFDVVLIFVAFWALGAYVNPATLFIAFGISSLAGVVSSIPGGAGVYETVMITFLASSGVPAEIAIAGTLLARVALLSGTVLFGYIFYQLTINKYGKAPTKPRI